jgi:hypothetical protein
MAVFGVNPHERVLTKGDENRVDRQFGRDGFAAGFKESRGRGFE